MNLEGKPCAERLQWLATTLQRLKMVAIGNLTDQSQTSPVVVLPLNKGFLNRLITDAQQQAVQWKKLNALVDTFPKLLQHTSRRFLARSILVVAKRKSWSVSSFLKHFTCAQIDNLSKKTIRALQALNQTYQERSRARCEQAEDDPIHYEITLMHTPFWIAPRNVKDFLKTHLPCHHYNRAVSVNTKPTIPLCCEDVNLDTDYQPLNELCEWLLDSAEASEASLETTSSDGDDLVPIGSPHNHELTPTEALIDDNLPPL